MLNKVRSKEQLSKEADTIQAFLEITCSEDIGEATARGCDLAVHIASSGAMIAEAKYILDKAIRGSILNEAKAHINLPASILVMLIKASVEEEELLFNRIEQINKSCKYQHDWCRTLVSKAKAEMQYG